MTALPWPRCCFPGKTAIERLARYWDPPLPRRSSVRWELALTGGFGEPEYERC
jgi:hypothetical protein